MKRGLTAATALVAIGAILYLVSGPLSWGKATLSNAGVLLFAVTVKGQTLSYIAAAVLIVLAVLLVVITARGGQLALSIVVVIGSLLALIIVLGFLSSKDPYITVMAKTAADKFGGSASAFESAIKGRIAAGASFDVSHGPGLFIALVGSILALIGGIFGIVRAASSQSAETAGTVGWGGQPGPGAPGWGPSPAGWQAPGAPPGPPASPGAPPWPPAEPGPGMPPPPPPEPAPPPEAPPSG